MKKLIPAIFIGLIGSATIQAQVVNRALVFEEGGTVNCGGMPQIDNLSSYSLQFWMHPDVWTPGATLLSRGSDLSVTLGPNNTIVFANGINTVSAGSSDLKAGEWNQVTLICENGEATISLNGQEVADGKLGTLSKSEDGFILGGGYSGLLDEVRVWNDALNEQMKTFDYFTNNTLNKWCPMWDNLVVYYKMDQENCPVLVDYKNIDNNSKNYDNHGIFSATGVSRTVAGNEKMPYLINSAYTNNDRFFDRTIPRDQYLLANDLIILGADVYASDGHIETKTPNNHAKAEGVTYMETFEGREGVISFDGTGSTRLAAPASTLNKGDKYGFETWLYLDEWTPGAYLFRKESEDGKNGLSFRLGEDATNPTLIVRVNGNEYISQDMEIPVGEWIHIGMAPGSGGSVIRAMMFFLNDKSIRPNVSASTTETDVTPLNNDDIPLYIGEGLKGKIDETLIWNKNLDITLCTKHMTNVAMPSINRNGNAAEMSACSAYYQYDNAEDLGYSSFSQDGWLNIMKGAYEGHAGVKYYISVQGYYTPQAQYGDWRKILNDPEKRARFAADLAEISKNYDGVELDLEWLENANAWKQYFVLCDEIKAGLPEGKHFRVSTHQAYLDLLISSADKSKDYDGFTWQQYGPDTYLFQLSSFKNSVNKMINNGFEKRKTMTSYSTTTSKGERGSDVKGVKGDILNAYVPSDANIDKYTGNGDTWSYMGPMQVYNRAKFTRENGLQGIFYWDMGNDNWNGTPAAPEMPEYNLAKYCSYGINANNDTIVTQLNVNHYAGSGAVGGLIAQPTEKELKVVLNPDGSEIHVSFTNGEQPGQIEIYALAGKQVAIKRNRNKVEISHLPSGLYILRALDAQGRGFGGKFLKTK